MHVCFVQPKNMSAEENETKPQLADSETEEQDQQQESNGDDKPLTWKDLVNFRKM